MFNDRADELRHQHPLTTTVAGSDKKREDLADAPQATRPEDPETGFGDELGAGEDVADQNLEEATDLA